MAGAFLLLVLFGVLLWGLLGGCPKCPSLGDGHFGHVRFKFFLKIDFNGHLVGGEFATFGGCCWECNWVKNDVHTL